MKSDAVLQQDVVDELRWQPTTKDAEIGVAAKGGVVTLTGEVTSYAQKIAAENTVERVSGVRALADELTIKLPLSGQRSDTEIAHAAVNALAWHVEVPDERIRVRVESGWVWLEGDVEWQYQRTSAERAVRYLAGVKGVMNMLGLTPKHASPVEVRQKIQNALRRRAQQDAEQITVDAHDGRVTLKGTARSWAERRDAERAAWGVPGVTAVDDRIAVRV